MSQMWHLDSTIWWTIRDHVASLKPTFRLVDLSPSRLPWKKCIPCPLVTDPVRPFCASCFHCSSFIFRTLFSQLWNRKVSAGSKVLEIERRMAVGAQISNSYWLQWSIIHSELWQLIHYTSTQAISNSMFSFEIVEFFFVFFLCYMAAFLLVFFLGMIIWHLSYCRNNMCHAYLVTHTYNHFWYSLFTSAHLAYFVKCSEARMWVFLFKNLI